MSPSFFGMVAVLACAALGFASRNVSPAAEFAERHQRIAQEVSFLAPALAQVAITPNAVDIFRCCRPADRSTLFSNRLRFRGNEPGNPALQNSLADERRGRTVGKAGAKNTETIVPKIEMLSKPPFWADSTSSAVIRISLEAVTGNQKRIYKSPTEISFRLAPVNASFQPESIKIPRGADHSEPATLTSSQPATIEVTSTVEGEVEELAINQPQPLKIEFLAPIDHIGIEPVSGSSKVNIGTQFLVYLCNHNDLKTHLSPTGPVLVQLASQSDNGSLDETKLELNAQHFSQNVRYVGTRMGYDTIIALAHYGPNEISGKSERRIVFAWWTFIAGLIGTLLGSLLRSKIGDPKRRIQNFIESFVYGLAFCLIVILFPLGTKLPHISSYNQPALVFALAILVSFVPEFLRFLLSFVPNKT